MIRLSLKVAPAGVAFYCLSSDRFCIALSHHSGAEYTGRGGQRVLTHNVIVSGDDLAKCGFNPFTIIRALPPAADSAKLPPSGALPALELQIAPASSARRTWLCTDPSERTAAAAASWIRWEVFPSSGPAFRAASPSASTARRSSGCCFCSVRYVFGGLRAMAVLLRIFAA